MYIYQVKFYSIIALVVKEMRDLWLVVNFAFYRYNNLARGDYSKGVRFQNGCFARVLSMSHREW